MYDGHREDELAYLKSYAEAPDVCVILAHDEGAVGGAATGMPFIHEGAQMLAAIAASQYNVEKLYYVGELLLYPAHRNKRTGLADAGSTGTADTLAGQILAPCLCHSGTARCPLAPTG